MYGYFTYVEGQNIGPGAYKRVSLSRSTNIKFFITGPRMSNRRKYNNMTQYVHNIRMVHLQLYPMK